MAEPKTHICVCICTFKRPELLANLLNKLAQQVTNGQFGLSVVVVDNDVGESARNVVELFQSRVSIQSEYYVQPEQNIALARNKAIQCAQGELVAFIDDDEFPAEEWLLKLYSALGRFKTDGVLGPVIPYYDIDPPKWILKARLFDRPSHSTGHVLRWTQTRTGNALLRRSVLSDVDGPFRRECGGGGEDRDLFKRLIDRGRVFVWCQEAPVYEVVPSHRLRRSFQIRRALLRGKASLANSSFGSIDILKSVMASCGYTFLLPVFLLLGQHVFMRYLIKDCDHIGRLLAACGIDLVREKYVTE